MSRAVLSAAAGVSVVRGRGIPEAAWIFGTVTVAVRTVYRLSSREVAAVGGKVRA